MAALGVSFGVVACLLGLVLGLCFADRFLVSGETPNGAAGQPHWVLGLWRCEPLPLSPPCPTRSP